MTLRRFFADALPPGGGRVTLPKDSAAHLRVLRLQPGDDIVLFDGAGQQAPAQIEQLDADGAVCLAESPERVVAEGPQWVLLLAMPKGSKLDDAIRMATEFGVSETLLLYTDHSVPRWDASRARQKLDRLARVSMQAARQSGQVRPCTVHSPVRLIDALDRLQDREQRVVFSVRARLGAPGLDPACERLVIAVGPEGGFSDAELDLLCLNKFSEASLGRSILRVDTALAAALGVIADRMICVENDVDTDSRGARS